MFSSPWGNCAHPSLLMRLVYPPLINMQVQLNGTRQDPNLTRFTSNGPLTPKIPWDLKLVDCSLGSLCGDFFYFFIFYFLFKNLDEWTTYFTRFLGSPSTLYEPVVKLCSKWVLSSFFLYFLSNSYMQPCGWNCPRVAGQGAKKEVCFVHRILVFHFFSLFSLFFANGSSWCHLQCDHHNLYVKFFFILLKKITRSIVLKVWVKTLSIKRILV
jgi:hypothetical protein